MKGCKRPLVTRIPLIRPRSVPTASAAIIATGAIVGGVLGAFSAVATGGNVIESIIEGCLIGALGSACGMLIANPVVAFGVAAAGGAVIDFSTQATTQFIEDKSVDLGKVDYGRVVDTGLQAGIGAAIPKVGDAASNSADAFATATVWGTVSAYMTSGDIVATNTAPNTATNTASNTATKYRTQRRSATARHGMVINERRLLLV